MPKSASPRPNELPSRTASSPRGAVTGPSGAADFFCPRRVFTLRAWSAGAVPVKRGGDRRRRHTGRPCEGGHARVSPRTDLVPAPPTIGGVSRQPQDTRPGSGPGRTPGTPSGSDQVWRWAIAVVAVVLIVLFIG